jgi:hypothetical protein
MKRPVELSIVPPPLTLQVTAGGGDIITLFWSLAVAVKVYGI